MPRRKIPHDAFYYYAELGAERSYEKVAERYGVTKRAVVKVAVRERWQERVEEFERKAREKAAERTAESLEAMNERHLKAVRALQGKALTALREMPIDSAITAVRALDLGIRQERVIRGEPSERTEVSIEEKIRREYERWMTLSGDDGDDEEDDDDDGAGCGALVASR